MLDATFHLMARFFRSSALPRQRGSEPYGAADKRVGLLMRRALSRRICIFAAALLASGTAFCAIIPSDRLIAWNPGIPGGVPNRTNIYTTLPAGALLPTIQNALNHCPSNGVVMLSPGTYIIDGSLVIPSYTTLRGAGTNTVLTLTGAGVQAAIYLGAASGNAWPQSPAFTAITGGATKGSTSITVANAAGISVGKYLYINELNDTNFVSDFAEQSFSGNPGPNCSGCGTGWPGDENRLMGQLVEVTSVSANNIGFNPPLYFTYKDSLLPQAYPFSMQAKYAGLESLKLSANNTGVYQANVILDEAAYSWVKNVESDFADGDHLQLAWCFRCEVRDSFFHDGFNHGPGTTDDTLRLGYKSTACLIENNIFWRMHVSVMLNYGCAGNVIAYNFSTNNYHDPQLSWELADFDFHAAHPMFNLFEGNAGVQFMPDSLHGTSSHSTCLRNWMSGANYYAPPQNSRGPIQWSSGFFETANDGAFLLEFTTSSNNLVGNIAGSPWLASRGAQYLNVATNPWVEPVCFGFGFDGSHQNINSLPGGSNLLPYVSVLMQGNYDFATQSQHWDPSIPDRTIPSSFYLGSKPAWFGSIAWPPFDPANPATASQSNLPAGYRFLHGTNPPSTSVFQLPVAVVTASPVSGSAPLLVRFSSLGSYDPKGTALSYSWKFGDSAMSTAANPSHAYQAPGVYSVSLAVSDGVNTTLSSNVTINVTAQP